MDLITVLAYKKLLLYLNNLALFGISAKNCLESTNSYLKNEIL